MKPKPQFGRIAKPQTTPVNHDREERAAIHEFDGQLTRPEAEARAAAECQHCGQARPLQPVWRASYGHGLDVCEDCAASLTANGWARGGVAVAEKLF